MVNSFMCYLKPEYEFPASHHTLIIDCFKEGANIVNYTINVELID